MLAEIPLVSLLMTLNIQFPFNVGLTSVTILPKTIIIMAVQEKPARTVIIATKANSEIESPDMLLSATMDFSELPDMLLLAMIGSITPPKVRQSTACVLYIPDTNECLKNDRKQ